MKNIVNSYVEKFRENHRRSRRMASILLALALVVAAGVFWQLHSTGIALTNETYCGLEEHTHSEDCYEEVLVCGLEESEDHTHSGDCYEEQLACGLEEHTHTVECLSDETADVETASDWEADLPDLTGILADDVVAIAESQLGYTESTKNFTLAEDGTTRQGYTRYGAWYGNEYGGWDAMFASFCLYYAGVDEDDFPQASGAYAWIASLKEMGLYASAGEDTPLPGDLVFFDTDEDGKADRVGIVTEVDEEDGSLTVIEGDYSENEDDADAVCETEYAADSSAIIGYGFLPPSDTAAVVSEEGETEAEIEEEKEENMLTAAASSNGALLAAASTGTELSSDYYDVSFKEVEYADGTVKASLYLDLLAMVTKYKETAFADDNYVFYYYIDVFEGVDLSTGKTAVLASDGDTVAYWYEIKYDDASGKYYVEFTFNEDFVNSSNTIDKLYFHLTGTVNEDNWEKEDDGSITIQFGTDSFHISYEDINFTDGSETTLSDINVSKSGTYDAASNTISYTVTVSSVNGTGGAVTLSDLLTLSGSLNADISTVTATVALYDGKGTDDTSDDEQVGTATDKSLSLTNEELVLDALEAGQYYIINYDVVVNTGNDLNVEEGATNKISVSTEDSKGKDLYDDDTDITRIKESLVSKSGNYNSKDGTITWTITVNASRVNIAGYSLTDSMLTEKTSITVDPNVGYTLDGNTITFNAVEDTDNNGENDSNTNTYTIKYTTTSDQTLGNKDVTNTAVLSGDGKSGEAKATVTTDGGSLTKANTNDSTAEVNEDGTITLSWTSSLTVPTGGIASGTEIGDYLNDQWSYSNGVSYTHQWYTYDQITDLFTDNFASGIKFTNVDNEEITNQVASDDFYMEVYYFSDKTSVYGKWVDYQTLAKDSSTYVSGYFTAWKITFNKEISFGGNKVKLTLNYETTADSTVVDGVGTTSYTYSNYINVGDLGANDSYTYKDYAKVVKTDGNYNSGNSSHAITGEYDNTLTWIVKVYIEEDSDYKFVAVTDTLPAGVKLDSISINAANGSTAAVGYQNNAWGSNSDYVTLEVTGDSSSGQTVTLTFDKSFYESLQQKDGGYIYITYTCKITDEVMSKLIGKEVTEESFTNKVKATYTSEAGTIDESYEDSQTQTVTYEEPDVSAVDKSYYWDNYNDRLTYYVLLNSGEEDLLADSDELTFTDEMSTFKDETYGTMANLIRNSVNFYTLTELTNGTWSDDTSVETNSSGTVIVSGTYTYTDSEGRSQSISYMAGYSEDLYVTPLTDKDELSSAAVYLKTEEDIAWTYSEETNYGTTSHIITATVPDETMLLVEYAYQITYLGYVEGGNNSFGVWNTANLSGSTSDSVSSTEKYTEANSGGGASYRQNFTLTKVDVKNYSTTLAHATYSLWKYNGTAWVDTGETYTTDADGQISFSFSDSGIEEITYEYNTAYYLVESVAPEGYLLDSTTKFYFYWSDSDTTTYPEKYPSDWSSLTTYNLTTASHSVIAENTPVSTTSVAVEKKWVDENGNDITSNVNSPESITFELYRYTANSSGGEDSGGSSDDTVTVYWNSISNQYDTSAYKAIGKVTEGEDVKIVLSWDENISWGCWSVMIGYFETWNLSEYESCWSIDTTSTGSEITIPAESVTGNIYIWSSNIKDVSIKTARGSLTLTKTFNDSTPNSLVKDNVAFTVTDSNGNEVSVSPITYGQMTNGSYTFSNLPVGTYTITESDADVSGGYTRTTTWKIGDLTYTGNSCSVTVSESGTTVNVKNSYEEGVNVVDPTGAVKVGEYTISADNGWTTSVSGLPATDSEGNIYYYYVKEVSDSGYSVYSYTNNEGINSGTITITNQTAEAYALPSTGGLGTDKYTLTGLLLCGGAGCLFFRRRRQLRKSR